MVHSFSEILTSLFSSPVANPKLDLIKSLRTLHRNSQVVPTLVDNDSTFPLSEYLHSIQVEHTIIDPDSQIIFNFSSAKGQQQVYPEVVAGIIKFRYPNSSTTVLNPPQNFTAYKVSWFDCRPNIFYALVFEGEDDATGQHLASEVYKFGNSLKDEIWVFEGGRWSKSRPLFKAIKAASWDEVVLKAEFKEGLRRDTETFFASEEVYTSLGITWKRGILLLGPPGNGKTESIKALLNEFDQPALYVKSFTTPFGPEHGIRSIFDHARKHSPCILILEDLDAMVTEAVRSFLLNELDGLAQNEGILTVATTNHPERIDDAILNRPSRFDVKYDFGLPDSALRQAFAEKWIEKVTHKIGASSGVSFERSIPEVAKEVAGRTEGWSFAFLKELFISFLLRLAHDRSLRQRVSTPEPRAQTSASDDLETMDAKLMSQIDLLAAQILNLSKKPDTQESTGGNLGALRVFHTHVVPEVNRSYAGPAF